MISQIIIFAILSAGSVFAASVFGKKYEEILPITSGAIVLMLFLFGIIGVLNVGVYVICIAAIALYAYALFKVLKQKNYKSVIKKIITPGFIIFLLAFGILSILNYGKIPDGWDEFSHWALSVKSAVMKDVLSTDVNSGLMFKSYPPGVTLFMYFVEEISIMATGFSAKYIEWKIYFGYQIFALSFLMPVFKKVTLKQIWCTVCIGVVLVLVPTLFFTDFFTKVFIDPILGLLSGVGLATVLLSHKKDWVYFLTIFSTIAMLVLAKDAGMAFAVFLFIAFAIDLWLQKDLFTKKKKIIVIGISLAFLILPYLLWNFSIMINGVERMFSNDIIISDAINVFLRKDTTYRSEVARRFFNAIFTHTVTLGGVGIGISYFVLSSIFGTALYFLYSKGLKMKGEDSFSFSKIPFVILIVQTITYIVGILLSYMFKFTEYEAVQIASFGRYMNVAFLAIWVVIVLLAIELILRIKATDRNVGISFMLSVMIITASWGPLAEFAYRTTAANSQGVTAVFTPLLNKISELDVESEKIYFIAQESNGYEYWISNYYAFPNSYYGTWNWSLGEPFYDGDIWTISKTAEEWRAELMEHCDYVAIHNINDYFLETYSGLFENPEEIQNNNVYKVNKETGMLTLVD